MRATFYLLTLLAAMALWPGEGYGTFYNPNPIGIVNINDGGLIAPMGPVTIQSHLTQTCQHPMVPLPLFPIQSQFSGHGIAYSGTVFLQPTSGSFANVTGPPIKFQVVSCGPMALSTYRMTGSYTGSNGHPAFPFVPLSGSAPFRAVVCQSNPQPSCTAYFDGKSDHVNYVFSQLQPDGALSLTKIQQNDSTETYQYTPSSAAHGYAVSQVVDGFGNKTVFDYSNLFTAQATLQITTPNNSVEKLVFSYLNSNSAWVPGWPGNAGPTPFLKLDLIKGATTKWSALWGPTTVQLSGFGLTPQKTYVQFKSGSPPGIVGSWELFEGEAQASQKYYFTNVSGVRTLYWGDSKIVFKNPKLVQNQIIYLDTYHWLYGKGLQSFVDLRLYSGSPCIQTMEKTTERPGLSAVQDVTTFTYDSVYPTTYFCDRPKTVKINGILLSTIGYDNYGKGIPVTIQTNWGAPGGATVLSLKQATVNADGTIATVQEFANGGANPVSVTNFTYNANGEVLTSQTTGSITTQLTIDPATAFVSGAMENGVPIYTATASTIPGFRGTPQVTNWLAPGRAKTTSLSILATSSANNFTTTTTEPLSRQGQTQYKLTTDLDQRVVQTVDGSNLCNFSFSAGATSQSCQDPHGATVVTQIKASSGSQPGYTRNLSNSALGTSATNYVAPGF